VAITEKQEAKLAKIRDIARRNELRMNVGAAASILKSLDSFGKKTEKQKEAQAKRSIIIDTAVGIMKTFSQLGYPGGIVPSIALALEGAAALSQVGGGSAPTVGGGTGADIDSEGLVETEQTVNITDITGGEIVRETIQIVISDESGNNFVDTLGTRIKSAESDGRI